MISRAVMLAVLGVLATHASRASADVVSGDPPAPPTCVRGATAARPERGHGYYCAAAAACTSSADCSGGACEETAVCILEGTDVAPYECGADGSCFSGTCSRTTRCVGRHAPPATPPPEATPEVMPPPTPPPPATPPTPPPAVPPPSTAGAPPPAGGWSCAARPGAGEPTVLALAALALLVARRRTPRR